MIEYKVSEFTNQPTFNSYIYLIGYCHLLKRRGQAILNGVGHRSPPIIVLAEDKDLNIKTLSERELLMGSKDRNILIFHAWTNDVVEDFFNKLKIEQGRIRILALLRYPGRLWIHSILTVELLDEKGNTVDSMKVAESEIPKEFRGKL